MARSAGVGWFDIDERDLSGWVHGDRQRAGDFLRGLAENIESVRFGAMKTLASLVLSLFVAATAFAGSSKVADISHDELTAAVASGKAVILDANGTESYQAGHIPGAIDYVANKDRLASLLPADKDTLVVAYCGNEQCGASQGGGDRGGQARLQERETLCAWHCRLEKVRCAHAKSEQLIFPSSLSSPGDPPGLFCEAHHGFRWSGLTTRRFRPRASGRGALWESKGNPRRNWIFNTEDPEEEGGR